MEFIYPAIVHDDADGLWAEFPDLPGCSTQGDSQGELLANAAEAMECYILGLLDDGSPVPVPTPPQDIPVPGTGAYLSLIHSDIDLAKNTRSVKKTLTIPAWMNRRAREQHINFSKVLQDALMKELKISG